MRVTKKNLLNIIKENYGFDDSKLREHHLSSKDDKIDFILKNQYLTDIPFISIEKLESMPDKEIDSFYNKIEDGLEGEKYNSDESWEEDIDIDFDELEIEEPVEENSLLGEDEKEINHSNMVDYIMDYESDNLSDEDTIKLFSHLIKTGLAWTLQGHYGRVATRLINGGYISKNGDILKQVGGFSLNESSIDDLDWIISLPKEYYSPSDSMEYYDEKTNTFYNVGGDQLRDPSEFNRSGEGYTPFGDEGDSMYESKILTKKQIMEQFNKKQNIKETTEVSKKHPSVINQERINKETAKETKQDRDQTFMKNMDKIVKGNDDFKTVEEPKFDKDSLKKEDILDKNAGMTAEENLEDLARGGLDELNYDRTSDKFKERMEKDIDPVKGKRIYANSVATDLGARINKSAKKKIKDKEEAPMYSKDIQPVNDKKENEGKKLSNVSEQKKNESMKKITNKVQPFNPKKQKTEVIGSTKIQDMISEESLKELEKMKHLFSYRPHDFINNKKNLIKEQKNEKTN